MRPTQRVRFRERNLGFPPERVARITGVPEGRLLALGERIAGTRPTAIKVGIGMQRHGGGGAAYGVRGFFPGDWEALWRDDLRPSSTRILKSREGAHVVVVVVLVAHPYQLGQLRQLDAQEQA